MLSSILMTLKGLIMLFGAVEMFSYCINKEDAQWVKGLPRTILLSLFVIGMWGQYVVLVYCGLFLLTAFLPRSRAEAAAIFAIAAVAIPILSYNLYLGPLYVFTCNKYIVAGLGLATACARLPRSSGPPRSSYFDIPILLILVLEIWEARDVKISDTLRNVIPVFLYIAVPYYYISRSLRTAHDLRRFMVAIALGGFAMAVIATVEWRLHWLIYKQVELRLHLGMGVNPYTKLRGGTVRAPASFPESTSLALYLALSCIAVVALRDHFRTRIRWYGVLAFFALGLLAANSRGGFLGLAIGLLAFDFYRSRYGALVAKLCLGCGLIVTVFAAAQFIQYFADMTGKGGTDATADYRLALFRRGMQEIAKHPLLGMTMKTALAKLEDMRQGEHIIDIVNGYIRYGLTAGFTGIVLLFLVFVTLCAAMWAAKRRLAASELGSNLAGFIFAVSCYQVLASFYTGFGSWWSVSFYQLCAVGSALWAIRYSITATDGSMGGAAAGPLSPVQNMIAADRAAAHVGRRRRGAQAPMGDIPQPAVGS